MSTSLASTDLADDIAIDINKSLNEISVFLDIEKAFHAMIHSSILNKAEHYGISGNANNWLSSYHAGRRQYVQIEFFKSIVMRTMCCGQQG